MSLLRAFVLGIASLGLLGFGLSACDRRPRPPPHGGGGQGGEGGCAVRPPEPLFVLDIRAEDGPLPPDLRVEVEWSAGDEPPFVLSDMSTWKTLDDGANFICRIAQDNPPPLPLSSLVCELWASGAVRVRVDGEGYELHDETLSPLVSELCGEPLPMEVAILLARAKLDAGSPP